MKLSKEIVVANAMQLWVNKNTDKIRFVKRDKQLNVCYIHIGSLVFSQVDNVEITYNVNASAQITFLAKNNDQIPISGGYIECPFNLEFSAKIDIQEDEEKGYVAQVDSIVEDIINVSINPNVHIGNLADYYKQEND